MSGSNQLRTYRRMESVVFLKTDEPFGGLSNMAGGYPIHVNGVRILTSEALYQVCRFPHLPDVQRMIIGQISPMTAKMRSKPYRKDSRPDWDQVRVRIMRWCLRMKLANNWSTFSELLLRTGDRSIVEESRKDDFWGAKATGYGSTLVGMNVLGRLLMELREQVKQQGREAALDVAPPSISQFLLLGRPIEVASGSAPPQVVADHEQGSLFGADTAVSVEASSSLAKAPSREVAYEAYRPARMRWLPPVPEHWNEQRAKTFFREVDERSKTGKEELLSVSHLTGVTPRSQKNVTMFKAESYVGSKLCRPGDIVVNTLWAWMAALGASKHAGIVSPAYGVYRPHNPDSFNPAYLDYLLRTRAYVAEYIGRSTGIRASRLRLYPNQFLDIPLIQPPRPEQDQIVAYLRAQDAHIARFIKAKRDLIALLTEQKLCIIDQAVTRGLDASVRLKPSAIEWLGDVPAHWNVCRANHVLDTVRQQIPISTLAEKEVFHYSIPSISKTGNGVVENASAIDSDKLLLNGGELLVSKLNPHKRYVLLSKPHSLPIVCSSEFVPLIARACDAEYARYVFQSWRVSGYLQANARSATRSHSRVDPNLISKLWWAWPDIAEQIEIVEHLRVTLMPLDEAIQRAEDEIKLIREYRDCLIANAVTGQVDVRGWQPGPDDVVSDEVLAALGDDEEEGNGED